MSTDSVARLTFLGAADTVTGSRYLVEVSGRRILVDCGLFQGYKVLRERNRTQFPVDPSSIDAVVVTHAHLDHSGYLPALVKAGYKGPIHASEATSELCGLLLPDSAHLMEEEARYAARKRYSRHAVPTPLYEREDADRALAAFVTHPFSKSWDLVPGVQATLIPAGHLLGAAQIALKIGEHLLHFSGDLGRAADPLMHGPVPLAEADWLVCESTYGNRVHVPVDAEAELAPILRRIAGRGGVAIIPAFAIGRAQGLMLHIARLKQRGEIPDIPVFLNSPMAVDATTIYHRHHDEHHVTDADCRAMFQVATMVRTVEESKALNQRHGPMIIISASGMLSGGRVLHHVEAFGSDHRNAIVLAGYQAGGTRGASLLSGAQSLRIFGRDVRIRAEVISLQSFSGHADADELIEWMRSPKRAPIQTFVTHGEPAASDALRARIRHELGREARVPEHLEAVDLVKPR